MKKSYKKEIINHLKTQHNVKIQSNKEWYTLRCPFCGDSDKHKESKHLNIRISKKDDIMAIKCFQPKCDIGGLLKRDHLIKLGVSDLEILNYVSSKEKENKKIINKISVTKLNLKIPLNIKKENKEYFEKRTGLNITEEMIQKYRIIGDIENFINMNKDKIDYNKMLWKLMYNEREGIRYIGFLNDSGTFLNFRSVNDKIKHIKIPIIHLPIYVDHKPYSIKRNFNIKKRPYIVIAEGVFDIINIYNYLNNYDGLFLMAGSVGGIWNIFNKISKYYYDVIWVFIRDEGVNIDFFKKIKKYNDYKFKHDAIVIYNEASKDFGEIMKPIKMKKIKI